MDITALKNPAVLALLSGALIVTNVVTYKMSARSDNSCAAVEQALAENQALLDALQQRQAQDDADLEKALQPQKGLNPNRSGGLDWNKSIR